MFLTKQGGQRIDDHPSSLKQRRLSDAIGGQSSDFIQLWTALRGASKMRTSMCLVSPRLSVSETFTKHLLVPRLSVPA
jgi:hypothetical protein